MLPTRATRRPSKLTSSELLYLALELLSTLGETAAIRGVPSRLTWVGSFVQFDHSFEKRPIKANEHMLEHFDDEKKFVSGSRYSDPKFLGTIFMEELACYVGPEKVVIDEVSPAEFKLSSEIFLVG